MPALRQRARQRQVPPARVSPALRRTGLQQPVRASSTCASEAGEGALTVSRAVTLEAPGMGRGKGLTLRAWRRRGLQRPARARAWPTCWRTRADRRDWGVRGSAQCALGERAKRDGDALCRLGPKQPARRRSRSSSRLGRLGPKQASRSGRWSGRLRAEQRGRRGRRRVGGFGAEEATGRGCGRAERKGRKSEGEREQVSRRRHGGQRREKGEGGYARGGRAEQAFGGRCGRGRLCAKER